MKLCAGKRRGSEVSVGTSALVLRYPVVINQQWRLCVACVALGYISPFISVFWCMCILLYLYFRLLVFCSIYIYLYYICVLVICILSFCCICILVHLHFVAFVFLSICILFRSPVLSSLDWGDKVLSWNTPPHPNHPHKLSKAKEGLYCITHPCPWLNNSAEIVHSPSFKERKMSKN